jgi:predicted transcriptional regulator
VKQHVSQIGAMNTMGASARFSMRLEPDLKEWLEEEAKLQDRSAGDIAAQAIATQKARSEARTKMIEEAVKEADIGIFVSSNAVHDWMDSWGTENELPIPQPDISLHRS